MMTEILKQPLDSPAAWRAADFGDSQPWRQELDAAAADEVAAAVLHAKATAKPRESLTAEDFPLPTVGARLAALAKELEGGLGFAYVAGFPTERFSDADNDVMMWGLGQYFGVPEPQDKAGALLHVVTDTGAKVDGTANIRGFQTSEEQTFHTDGGDVAALMCLRQAKSGGISRIASSTAIFNEIARLRPDLAQVLQEPFHFDSRAQNPWDVQVQSVPIFTYHDGHLNALYKRRYVELAQRFEDVARLSEAQIEAMDMVDAIALDPAFHLEYQMQPGDLSFVNNFTCFHSRTRYVDQDDPAQRRRMLRLWLTLDQGRPLPPIFGETREWGVTYERRLAKAG
jgi:hypothetical protein